jgi:hypothetical protein
MLPFLAALRGGPLRRYGPIIATAVAAVTLYAWIDLTYSLPWNPDRPTPPVFPAGPLANACDNLKDTNTLATNNEPIPNIVHYIWLLADPAVFSLDFKVFVSAYSSHLFFHPDRIYFHTDVAPELWERAKSSGDLWTKRILAIPGVTPNFIENPRFTSKNVEIDTFGAKSDFIRAVALREFGGIYLDVDVVPLRDVAPLRNAGFANVVGGAVALAPKHTGYVNTGVWLSRPHSTLVEIFYKGMDVFYNGKWAISVEILTDLAYRLNAVPGEVLIMHPRAFGPTSWEEADQVRLFKPHPNADTNGAIRSDAVGAPKELRNTCADALAWFAEREQAGRMESWEMDFSSSYVLHAIDELGEALYGKINLKSVLARQSNYARAVYPAIRHAIDAGIIPMGETL